MAFVIKCWGGTRGDLLKAFIPGGTCHEYEYHVGTGGADKALA
jgi:hypothetical protein